MTTVTQWFNGNQKPKHVGVYQRKLPFTEDYVFSRYDGKNWFWFSHDSKTAEKNTKKSDYQNRQWRGVAR